MTVTLNLPPETEYTLRQKAAQNGQTLEGYLEVLAREAAAAVPVTLSFDEWAAQFRAWGASHTQLPALADDSRDSIYEGRGELNTLLDTNILTRCAQPAHPMCGPAGDALTLLRQQGDDLFLVPQNFYEFWVVATRPVAVNGLGMSPAQAQAELTRLKQLFTVLEETPAVFTRWEQLVVQYQVMGKNGHDARLVAAMLVHGVGRLLTFNTSDFLRYQGITVVSPQDVLSLPGSP